MSWSDWGGGGTATKGSTTQRARFGPLAGWGGGGLFNRNNQSALGNVSGSGGYPESQVLHNPIAPPTPAFGSDWTNILDTPGHRFNQSGQVWNPTAGSWADVNFPEYIRDPASFYAMYQEQTPGYRAAMLANERSAYDTRNDEMAQLQRGRDWLTGQQQQVGDAATSWANDPGRNLAMQGMMERAAPGYEFFSPTERTAATQPIAQSYARNSAMMQADQARRGIYGSGQSGQDRGALAVLADTGGMQVRAQIDAAERQLKEQALKDLAGTTSQFNAADTAYVNAGNQLAGALASLESGVDFEPTDYSVWPALNDATQRAADESRFRDEALQTMEKESQFGFQDLSQLVLSSLGTGLWDMVL
jgi:hypothetical protein